MGNVRTGRKQASVLVGLGPIAAFLITAAVAVANSDSSDWPPAHPPGWQQYWASRRIVTIAAYRSHRETLDSTVVLDNAGSPSSSDSVRRLTERILRIREGDPVEYVHVALDSSAQSFSGRQGIPDFAARPFSSGKFRQWIKALDPQGPRRAWDSFMAVSVDSFVAPGIQNKLAEPFVENKKRLGLLAISPGSSYVLDPFAEVEFDSDGSPGYDAEGWGYGVMDAKSGDVLAWSDMMGPFFLGGWIDNNRFLLVGWSRLDSPVRIPGTYLGVVLAPLICVGDMRHHLLVSYLGRPIDDAVLARLRHVQSAAYPRVKW